MCNSPETTAPRTKKLIIIVGKRDKTLGYRVHLCPTQRKRWRWRYLWCQACSRNVMQHLRWQRLQGQSQKSISQSTSSHHKYLVTWTPIAGHRDAMHRNTATATEKRKRMEKRQWKMWVNWPFSTWWPQRIAQSNEMNGMEIHVSGLFTPISHCHNPTMNAFLFKHKALTIGGA